MIARRLTMLGVAASLGMFGAGVLAIASDAKPAALASLEVERHRDIPYPVDRGDRADSRAIQDSKASAISFSTVRKLRAVAATPRCLSTLDASLDRPKPSGV